MEMTAQQYVRTNGLATAWTALLAPERLSATVRALFAAEYPAKDALDAAELPTVYTSPIMRPFGVDVTVRLLRDAGYTLHETCRASGIVLKMRDVAGVGGHKDAQKKELVDLLRGCGYPDTDIVREFSAVYGRRTFPPGTSYAAHYESLVEKYLGEDRKTLTLLEQVERLSGSSASERMFLRRGKHPLEEAKLQDLLLEMMEAHEGMHDALAIGKRLLRDLEKMACKTGR